MALDATIGGADSNSYATVLQADAYFASRYHVSFWATLTDADKEKLLITNTALLDWYIQWNGLKISDEQALAWPRSGVYSELGNEYAADVVPKPVITALFEMIISGFEEDRTSDSGLEGLSMLKVSSLQMQVTDKFANPPRKTIPDKIYKILGHLCEHSRGVVWLTRC